ncbi:hypothetical protein SLS62_003078 [Diatrype stigma]|uniref:Rhodopsin domain-containing protein n=1 Tax=Diatrype stigma TaxID=117547 RepID=A0AAN9V5M0_9PEZI
MSSTGTLPDAFLKESKQPELKTLLIAMTIVPTVVVFIRAWSRALLPVDAMSKIPSRFWWDDWTAFAGAILNIAVCGVGFKLINLGLGLHTQAVPPENIEPFLKLLWIVYFIFDTGEAVARSSAIFFYARVLSVPNSRFNELQQDITYKVSTPVLWLGSEIAICIISVSLPMAIIAFTA